MNVVRIYNISGECKEIKLLDILSDLSVFGNHVYARYIGGYIVIADDSKTELNSYVSELLGTDIYGLAGIVDPNEIVELGKNNDSYSGL